MTLRIGYYGNQRVDLLDLVHETCRLLGGNLMRVDSLAIPPVDILLWNFVAPMNITTHAILHRGFNVYLLPERGERPRMYSSRVDPEAFYEKVFFVPFDPEELALLIVDASHRRGYQLSYQFDPTFYTVNQSFFDKYTLPAP